MIERQKKLESLARCASTPSFLSKLATLKVPGLTKSQPAQHKKSLGIYLNLTGSDISFMKRALRAPP